MPFASSHFQTRETPATAVGRSGFLLSGTGWAARPNKNVVPVDAEPSGSGFSQEIEAHCWRVVPRDGRGLWGWGRPQPGWESCGGSRKMSQVGQTWFDAVLGMWEGDL